MPVAGNKAIIRNGFYTEGDSPQAMYVTSNSACPLNGDGDGGS
jgi:hypothetical protein